jgi:hypothetical protein
MLWSVNIDHGGRGSGKHWYLPGFATQFNNLLSSPHCRCHFVAALCPDIADSKVRTDDRSQLNARTQQVMGQLNQSIRIA